jgi:hypothetical protein
MDASAVQRDAKKLAELFKRPRSVNLPLSNDAKTTAEADVSLVSRDYSDILAEYGYTGLADAIYADSEQAKHPFFTKKYRKISTVNNWRSKGRMILTSSPKAMLEAVLDGTLAQAASTNGQLHEYFDKSDDDQSRWSVWAQQSTKDFAPCIYVRQLVDRHGKPPPSKVIELLLSQLQDYISGLATHHERNAKIDCQTRGKSTHMDIASGLHHHLDGSQARARVVHTFCKALEQRLQEASENTPLVPLVYCGYAASGDARAAQHSSGKSTNWLSALVIDILKSRFRTIDGIPLYNMQTFTVCFLTSYEECQLAEEFFTRMTGSYYYTGRGFNIDPAGCSLNSANLGDELTKKSEAMWKECEDFRYDLPFIEEQLNEEVDTFKVYQTFIDSSSKERQEVAQAREARTQELQAKLKGFARRKEEQEEEIRTERANLRAAQARALLSFKSDEYRKLYYENIRDDDRIIEDMLAESSNNGPEDP